MEYFSRKLGLQYDGEASQRFSLTDQSARSGMASMKALSSAMQTHHAELSAMEDELAGAFDVVKIDRERLEKRRLELEKDSRSIENRFGLMVMHEAAMKTKLEDILARREKAAALETMADERRQHLGTLRQELEEKRSLVVSKKEQLNQRLAEVKHLKSLLVDAKTEKYESSINHIVLHSRELADIKDLWSKSPGDDLRLSVLCQDRLDKLEQLKHRQAGIYALDLTPSDSYLVHLNHLKIAIHQQKTENIRLFNRIKNLHEHANFKSE